MFVTCSFTNDHTPKKQLWQCKSLTFQVLSEDCRRVQVLGLFCHLSVTIGLWSKYLSWQLSLYTAYRVGPVQWLKQVPTCLGTCWHLAVSDQLQSAIATWPLWPRSSQTPLRWLVTTVTTSLGRDNYDPVRLRTVQCTRSLLAASWTRCRIGHLAASVATEKKTTKMWEVNAISVVLIQRNACNAIRQHKNRHRKATSVASS